MRILIQYNTGQIQPLEIAGTVGIEIGGRMFMTKDLEKALLPKCPDHCGTCGSKAADFFTSQCFGCKMVEGGRPTNWTGEEI
jgi:hypothetical protein